MLSCFFINGELVKLTYTIILWLFPYYKNVNADKNYGI